MKGYKNSFARLQRLELCLALAVALWPMTAPAARADGMGWTVTNSGGTFTVTRTDTTSAATVLYRTVSFSALAGQHFAEVRGELTFAAGEASKTVTAMEKMPTANAYKYQTDTSRAYRFEVLDRAGTLLAFKNRGVSSGMSSGKYLEVSYTPPTSQVETSGVLTGYVLIDDEYDYVQKPAIVSTSALISGTHSQPLRLQQHGVYLRAVQRDGHRQRHADAPHRMGHL